MAPDMVTVIDLVLLALLCATAIAIVLVRRLFAAAMLSGAFSMLSAGLLVTLDAVDVAFTEAAVGAGVSTVLLLGTLALTQRRAEETRRRGTAAALLFTALTGGALVYATTDMPGFGDADAPGFRHVVPEYIAGSASDIVIPNIVTAVLASYRGYDTLGEVAVIFTAGVGVLLLLGRRREDEVQDQARRTGAGGEG